MEILAYLYMALAYEESQEKILNCMRYFSEECPQTSLEYVIYERTSSSAIVTKNRCLFGASKV